MVNVKLQNMRLKKRWSKERAARECGIGVATWHRWEKGEQEPRLSSVDLMCNVFQCEPGTIGYGHLVPVEPEPEPATAITTLSADQTTIALFLLQFMQQAQQQGDMTMPFEQGKRDFLQQVMGMAKAGLFASTGLPLLNADLFDRLNAPVIDQQTLDHFGELTQLCWKLSNDQELDVPAKILPTYLPKMISLASQPGEHQATVSNLASQGLQLQSILVAHKLDLLGKIEACKNAVSYGRMSKDPNTLVAALLQLAVAYRYANMPEKSLETYNDACRLISQCSPLLQARARAETAEAYARIGNAQMATRYLAYAHEAYPAIPEHDPAFLFADCPAPVIGLYEGLAYLNLDRPGDAFNALAAAGQGKMPERIYLEIANHQARAATGMRDLDQASAILESATARARILRSDKRLSEARGAYQEMLTVWPQETKVKQLAELFHI